MAVKYILTDQEIKIFNRAGWIYGALCLIWVVWMLIGWNGYFHDKAVLEQQEAAYAQRQEEQRRLQSFMRSTQLNSISEPNKSFNAVTGE